MSVEPTARRSRLRMLTPLRRKTDIQARRLRRGYYAATSYMDAQLGRVIAELDKLGLRDSTIIIVWGDHGWHLGDLDSWCKHTNFEVATRSAMMISVPGMKYPGSRTDALTEFVDIYPTLCELAAVKPPVGLEGEDTYSAAVRGDACAATAATASSALATRS